MFERETKREKILEARHREMRLKERARSEGQGLEAEEMLEESPQDALDRAQKEFFEVIEAELQRRARAEAQQPGSSKVRGPAAVRASPALRSCPVQCAGFLAGVIQLCFASDFPSRGKGDPSNSLALSFEE